MSECDPNTCDCGPKPQAESGVNRRQFLAGAGALAGAAAIHSGLPRMAGPFAAAATDTDDFIIPADKKLAAAWVRSLTERGEPAWYSGDDLKHIGMAVGGLCCGQVYLAGDGRLWHWDIFNQGIATATYGPHYAKPMSVASPVDIGFALRLSADGKQTTRSLDGAGFPRVRFRGAYPMGFVEYRDDQLPVEVSLEAFSPFVPLDADASSLPMTVMRYTVRNTSQQAVEVTLAGALTNPVLLHSGGEAEAEIVNEIVARRGATCLHCTAQRPKQVTVKDPRPEIVFEDFESAKYENWTPTGTAFGDGPVVVAEMPEYQGNVNAHGKRLVNSHNTRNGEDVTAGDAHTGTLTSKAFTIERRYIHALVGGGADANQTALQLLIDGKVVAKLAGDNNNRMKRKSFAVGQYEGKRAQLRIVDNHQGGWGNIGVDHIVFSDTPAKPVGKLEDQRDYGDMTLAVLDAGDDVMASAKVAADPFAPGESAARGAAGSRPKGMVGKTLSLPPGKQATVSFAVAWRFANQPSPLPDVQDKGHYYAERFDSSLAVVDHHAAEHEQAYARTQLWHDTWYDSTLPYWLLDRAFVNTSTLATSTCLRFEGGRLWGWEGVGCCAGTCQHVWHYAQSVGRVFPELERIVRQRVDYGVAYRPDGRLLYRGEWRAAAHEAIDGQCGTILRVYREHTMSADSEWLRPLWPKIRKSIEFLIGQPGGETGVLTGKQMNTLDSAWYGPVSWLSSLYLAALRAGAVMAKEVGDSAFATRCEAIIERGSAWLSDNLFDGEYFYHRRDPKHPGAIGSGIGCLIDQVMGQGWAHQLALGRILPEDKTVTALRSLWRYNFAPDVGPYRARHKRGRWYAVAGEAGLLMCTFPRGGIEAAGGGTAGKGFAGYFNECMTGFEYQAAGHMIAEDLVTEGLAVTRAIHDRYHPSRRNPYNEIECGDHYARAMASHGVFVALCGFEHHGPKGRIGFAPRLTPADFRAPFIAAEGWGTYRQKIDGATMRASLEPKFGRLRVSQWKLAIPAGMTATAVRVKRRGAEQAADLVVDLAAEGDRVVVTLRQPATIQPGRQLECELDLAAAG